MQKSGSCGFKVWGKTRGAVVNGNVAGFERRASVCVLIHEFHAAKEIVHLVLD